MMSSRNAALVILALSAASFSACVDTEPLAFEETDSGATNVDAATDSTLITACGSCIRDEGAPCRSVYETCVNDYPGCQALTDCLIEAACYTWPTLEERIACGNPCLQALGIQVGADPAIQGTLLVNGCTLDACQDVCRR